MCLQQVSVCTSLHPPLLPLIVCIYIFTPLPFLNTLLPLSLSNSHLIQASILTVGGNSKNASVNSFFYWISSHQGFSGSRRFQSNSTPSWKVFISLTTPSGDVMAYRPHPEYTITSRKRCDNLTTRGRKRRDLQPGVFAIRRKRCHQKLELINNT